MLKEEIAKVKGGNARLELELGLGLVRVRHASGDSQGVWGRPSAVKGAHRAETRTSEFYVYDRTRMRKLGSGL